jgi:hypothetical protein
LHSTAALTDYSEKIAPMSLRGIIVVRYDERTVLQALGELIDAR